MKTLSSSSTSSRTSRFASVQRPTRQGSWKPRRGLLAPRGELSLACLGGGEANVFFCSSSVTNWVSQVTSSAVSSLRVGGINKVKGGPRRAAGRGRLASPGIQTRFPVRRGQRLRPDPVPDWALERIQVKHARSNGHVLEVRCESNSLTNGRVLKRKRYTDRTIDWLAVYDATTQRCYYLPAELLGDGRSRLTLRLTPPRNAQRQKIRMASEYTEPERSPRDSRH